MVILVLASGEAASRDFLTLSCLAGDIAFVECERPTLRRHTSEAR